MPVYLRSFYYNELVKTKKQEDKQIQASNQKQKKQADRINIPQ